MTTSDQASDWVVEQWTAICSQSPTHLAIFDRESRFVAASQRWIDDYENGRRDFLGRNYYEVHPEGPERSRSIHQFALSGETSREDNERFPLDDGRELWCRWICSPWRLPDGSIGGFMINTEDGTLQNQLERQAHRFANDLAPILDALPVGVARIDNRLRYVFVNCVYGTYFGRSASDIVGQRVEDIIGLEAFTTAGAKMQAALAGEAQTFEIPVRFADGKSHHLHVRFVPDRSLSGRVIGFYAVVADMSDTRERKAEVEAMRDRFDELTRRQVAQQTIIAVAHELRQPLHAAGVFAEIARKECRAPSRSRELEHALTRTGEEIDRASSVLTHLFDSIRNNGGDPLTAVARIDLNSLVATVMAHYKDRHPGMAACFEAALDKEALPVVVTPAAIEKILINLLRNASDALVCEDGCPPAARIAVGTHLDRGRAIMCVTDNAGGVPATIRPHLFEPFHTTKASGLGIGLSICKQLAEYQHGRLWHEDRPGGSAFLLSLPLAP